MKKYIIIVTLLCIIGLSIPSCNKEPISSFQETEIGKEYNAYKEFSVILSKALYENECLRLFLKQEAQKQFDKDYDVLYFH